MGGKIRYLAQSQGAQTNNTRTMTKIGKPWTSCFDFDISIVRWPIRWEIKPQEKTASHKDNYCYSLQFFRLLSDWFDYLIGWLPPTTDSKKLVYYHRTNATEPTPTVTCIIQTTNQWHQNRQTIDWTEHLPHKKKTIRPTGGSIRPITFYESYSH